MWLRARLDRCDRRLALQQAKRAPDAVHGGLTEIRGRNDDTTTPRPDWQKIACAVAARGRFALITGGPGTGKTTTVVRLLALLQLEALSTTGQALRIRLAAPTGKAAARLSGAIASAVARLPLASLSRDPRLVAGIPSQVGTLHRLLGPLPDSIFRSQHPPKQRSHNQDTLFPLEANLHLDRLRELVEERRDAARLLFRKRRVALERQRLSHGRQRRRSVACNANSPSAISSHPLPAIPPNHTELRRAARERHAARRRRRRVREGSGHASDRINTYRATCQGQPQDACTTPGP